MFDGCTSLAGGNHFKFNSDKKDYSFAKIDRHGTNGYFTYKSAAETDDAVNLCYAEPDDKPLYNGYTQSVQPSMSFTVQGATPLDDPTAPEGKRFLG